MIVIEHYWLVVLIVAKSIFDQLMFFLLGDRLTTARDRAAQDQRAVDRSPSIFDHLSCFQCTSGVMHVCMNMCQNLGRTHWGRTNCDAVSLLTLRDQLPNRSNITPQKIDFYT
jgi:hypothetical protein